VNRAWLRSALGACWLGAAAAACDPEVTSIGSYSAPTSREFEAESGELSGGFSVEPDPDASNAAFLLSPAGIFDDAPGDALAVYEFSVPIDGVFRIWGRIRSPGASENRFWIQVDAAPWFQWRISVGDIWFWDDFHDDTEYDKPLLFELAAGRHELRVANSAGGAALDRFRVAEDGDEPPANSTDCDPPHSIDLDGTCHASCGSQSGTLCGQVACSGKTIFEAYDCDVCCREAP
jgi:hypothetical protein